MKQPKSIGNGVIPNHIAVIMDGNGRWAKSRGKNRIFGHKTAIKAVRDTIEGSAELGVNHLTLYAFSSENWNRPKAEVRALMELLVNTIKHEMKTLNENDIRLLAIGELDTLPSRCKRDLSAAIESTKDNKAMDVTLALSYSGRREIISAVKELAKDVQSKKVNPDHIDEELFKSYLTTCDFPDPDLMIRTGGEHRISNFLLWQLAYTELVFINKFWPDFRKSDLHESILEFQKRERRFGKTSEQVALS